MPVIGNFLSSHKSGTSGGAPAVNPDFVFTVDTTQAGSAADTIVLPLLSGGTYSGTIDWGDTSTSSLSYANRSHTYAAGGTYTITISGDTLQGWQFANAGDKAKMTEISNWGLFEFTEIRTFQGCINMDITATDVPTISTTNFSTNFFGCNGITTTQDWSGWDMSGVTTYTNCFASNTAFNGDLSNWVTASTTGVSKMFNNATAFNGTGLDTWVTGNITVWTELARGATSFNSDVSGWVVNGAMTSAFLGCSSFVGNGCSTWDVSGMTSASGLFSQCVLFSENISGWDTSSCTNMTSMLRNCDAFNRNISTWDINQVSAFANFMTDATGLETALYDALLIAWDAQGAMSYTGTVNFGTSQYSCRGEAARTSLISKWGGITDGGLNTSINCDFVSTWDTTQAGSASDTVVLPLLSGGTYSGTIDWGDGGATSTLSYANRTHTYASGGTYTITISGSEIEGWTFNNGGDKAKITDVSNWGVFTLNSSSTRAFFNCPNLNVSAVDSPSLDAGMTDVWRLFASCPSLTALNLSGTEFSNVTNIRNLFENSSALTTANISSIDVSSVTNMTNTFYNCDSLTDDLSTWNVSSVQIMTACFKTASGSFLSTIGGWTTTALTTMNEAFRDSTMNTDISGWNVSSVTTMDRLFMGNTAFNHSLNTWNTSSVQNMYRMFLGATAYDQSMSNWDVSSVTNFTQFLSSGGGLSTANYDDTLIGWEASLQAAYPGGSGYTPTINIDFGSSQYTLGSAAETARTSLITTFGWTITDGGPV